MISRMYCGINIRRTNSTTIHPFVLSIRSAFALAEWVVGKKIAICFCMLAD
jgi:hypothetical protein